MAGTPKQPRRTRRYSDSERAAALAALDANGGNVRKTAKQIGVPRKTLEEWSAGHCHPEVQEIRKECRATLAERFEQIIHQILDVMPGKIADSGLQQLVVTAAIAVDKMQLLKGANQSGNSGKPALTNEQRIAAITGLLAGGKAGGA
jgi:hypothetical protein